MEIVLLLVQWTREEREHLRLRILLDALLGAAGLKGGVEGATKRMDLLTREVFFREEIERRKKSRDPAEVLKRWLQVGQLRVQA